MMKMLLVFLGLLLALGVAAYLFLASRLDSLVVHGVNAYGPKLTQTKVELVSASLSPLTGSGSLTGLSVGNPAGWSDGRAFYLGKVQVDVELRSVLGDPIVINEISIDQPEFAYESTFISSNIKDLLKNMEKSTGKGGGGREPAAREGQSRKFIVKKFRLTNGKATVEAGGKALVVTLPAISLDNLGVVEGGITAGQLSGVLMNRVLGGIVAGTAKALGSEDLSVDKIKAAAKKAADEVKKMFERKQP
ncbi:MAG: hypothetical protein AAB578_08185 [Elusimicrobiota bacterium]